MQGVTKTPHSSSLAQVVCDWKPSQLPELAKTFAASCKPPEVSFPSYHSYKAYFEPLLLAEVAAELLSASEKYQRTTNPRVPKVRARREEPGTTVALVKVQKVTRHHNAGFGWCVDLDSQDRKGPVGAIDNDVVILWPATPIQVQSALQSHVRANSVPPTPRGIPKEAVHAVIVRSNTRTGCRVVLSNFPDGNEHGVRTDLEEGEENEEEPPAIRVWNLLRIGGLTTMRREFEALQKIRTSILLPVLLRPKLPSTLDIQGSGTASDGQNENASRAGNFRNEEVFTRVISEKTGLNPSQTRAILYSSTCRNGFSVIQGPPGTGKTRTLISMLNVIHMTQYQEYYESLLASFQHLYGSSSHTTDPGRDGSRVSLLASASSQKGGQGSLLQTMMVAMNKTISTTATDQKVSKIPSRARRPRLLICAPSNSAVDEILTRLTRSKFVDGQGREYCPELARIGAGDKVSDAAKQFTAEGQAEAFLDRVCAEGMTPEAQRNAQKTFMASWQNRCNTLLMQMERTPKKQASSEPVIIDLHEKLERMDRDLRRLKIAASDGTMALTREEKLRQIARTYVEDAQLVFATLSGSASSILTQQGSADLAGDGPLFDTVVIDEGAQATETSSLIPLTLGANRCLLVGDPQQLPATVLSSGAAGLAYGQSLLERICRGGQSVLLLDKQYRMHPAISSFPRRYFYNGRLVDDESVQGENRARPYHRDAIRPKLGPYVFLDISEGEEQMSRDDRSIFNRAEAELASLIYTKLKKEYASDSLFSAAAKVPGSVMGFGVVTPYKRQMQELRQSFDRAGIPTGDVEIDTVDSYQGREKDVVVFSCVRTAAVNRGIGFVRDVRRMNVGLTRARASLIILGSAQALAEGSADWAELIEDATSRGCLISVSNVQRCLLPAGADPAVSSPQAATTDLEPPKDVASENLQRSNVSNVQRNSQGSGPSDPRKRVGVRRDTFPNETGKPQSLVSQQTEDASQNPNHQVAVAVEAAKPGFQRGPVSEPDSRATSTEGVASADNTPTEDLNAVSANAVGVDTELDQKSAELQSTLKQMTKILSDAGFHNTKALEDTLKEHIRSGGALDLETVMAAAIATNNTSAASGDNNGASNNPLSLSDSARLTNVPKPENKPEREPNQDLNGAGNSEGMITSQPTALVKQEASLSDEKGKSKMRQKDRSSKGKSNANRDRNTKSTSKDKPASKNAQKQAAPSPSGWDMLFASKKGSAPIDEKGNASGKASNVTGNDGQEDASPKSEVLEAMESGIANDPVVNESSKKEVATEGKSPNSSSIDGDSSKDGTSNGADLSQNGGNKQKRNWNDKGREQDRKRPRSGEHGAGRGGARTERGRGRPKRGRGRGSFPSEQNPQDRFTNNDSWPAQYDPGGYDQGYDPGYDPGYEPGYEPGYDPGYDPNYSTGYDPAYVPYPMMGNGLDQGMGANSHPMNSMQQAMQQQMMQQQMFQQQAFQQQAFQQQVLQQQALQQQEAYRQQAVLMQMSGAGVPTGTVPNPYQMVDFGGLNPATMGNPGQSQGSSHWPQGGGGGRGSRGGRGRGRMKNNGRGRRAM